MFSYSWKTVPKPLKLISNEFYISNSEYTGKKKKKNQFCHMHNATIRSAFSNSNQLSQQELQTHRIKAKEQVDTEHVQVLFIRDLQNRAQRRALLWQSSAPLVLTQNYHKILWREASHPSIKIPINLLLSANRAPLFSFWFLFPLKILSRISRPPLH